MPEFNRTLVEQDGIKCYLRQGTSDTDVWRENIIDAEIAKHLTIGEGQKWLDIGGYIGTFALFVLQRHAQVISFEPWQSHVAIYKENLQLNGYESNLIPAAVLHTPPVGGKADLILGKPHRKAGEPFINLAKATLINRWKSPHPSIEVSVISFADAVLRAKRSLGMRGHWNLKIDAEGPEGDILEFGDLSLFRQLFFEYHYQQADPTYERAPRIMARLEGLGFKVKLSKPLHKPRWWNDTAFLCWASR